MATINYTLTEVVGGGYVVAWTPLTESDTAAPFIGGAAADRSVQVQGTFNGGTVVFEGSNDGTNYQLLTDPQGNDISKTAADLEAITEAVKQVRPRVSAGTGVSLTVSMFIKR